MTKFIIDNDNKTIEFTSSITVNDLKEVMELLSNFGDYTILMAVNYPQILTYPVYPVCPQETVSPYISPFYSTSTANEAIED